MTKLQSSEIASAIDKIVEGLNMLKNAVSTAVRAEEPEPSADKVRTESAPPATETRPVQLQLPLPPVTIDHPARRRAGDAGYENEVNPVRRACGQCGRLATAGVKRAPCPDRRRRGSVMVKNMSVNEKRRYWRWSKFRAMQRSAGIDPVSWAAWVGDAGVDA